MNAPTTTHEMKYGKNITDCVIRLNHFPASSERRMAQVICRNVFTQRKATLYRMVLRVTLHAFPDWKKYSKFLNPTHGLPKMPSW